MQFFVPLTYNPSILLTRSISPFSINYRALALTFKSINTMAAPINPHLQTFQNAVRALLAQTHPMTTTTLSQPIAALLAQLNADVATYVAATQQNNADHRPLVFPHLMSFKTTHERTTYWGAGATLNQINRLTTELRNMPVGQNRGLRMGVIFSCMNAANVSIATNATWHAAVVVWNVPQRTLWVYDPGFPTDLALLPAARQQDLRISDLLGLANVAHFIQQFPGGWTFKISGDPNPNQSQCVAFSLYEMIRAAEHAAIHGDDPATFEQAWNNWSGTPWVNFRR
jgi:hypothetical protein